MKYNKGFLLIEVLLSISLVAMILTGIVGALFLGRESVATMGMRTRAWLYAEEAVEALKNIRHEDFDTMADGTYGLVFENDTWNLVPTGSGSTLGPFTREITLSTIAEEDRDMEVVVSWDKGLINQGSVSIDGRATNWRKLFSQANNLLLNFDFVDSGAGGQGNSQVVGIFMENVGPLDITIDKMRFEWDKQQADLEEIVMDAETVWKFNGGYTPSGKQASIAEVDITDVRLIPESVHNIHYIIWDQNINNVDITMTFIMADETELSVTFAVQGRA